VFKSTVEGTANGCILNAFKCASLPSKFQEYLMRTKELYIDRQVQSHHLRAFGHFSRELPSILWLLPLEIDNTNLLNQTPCMQRKDEQIYRPP